MVGNYPTPEIEHEMKYWKLVIMYVMSTAMDIKYCASLLTQYKQFRGAIRRYIDWHQSTEWALAISLEAYTKVNIFQIAWHESLIYGLLPNFLKNFSDIFCGGKYQNLALIIERVSQKKP